MRDGGTSQAASLAAELAAELAAAIDVAGVARPQVAFVLGSGLGSFAETVDGAHAIPFSDLASMPRSRVPGHAGRFVVGRIGAVPVLCQQGRVHLYEGHDAEVVTRAVRSLASLGVRTLVLTNAAGGLVAGWPVPCLMRVTDHVNLQGVAAPGPIDGSWGRRSARVYDSAVGRSLGEASTEARVPLFEGVYAGLAGPSYETAAEIRMLAALPAQAVGMSTVLEATAGTAAGMRVGAVSCITNAAAGIAAHPLDHAEVVEAGARIADDFARLLRAATPRLA